MAIRLVMTCHAQGWQDYGRNMVQTFVERWPAEVTLDVYAEGFSVDVSAPNVVERRLPGWHDDWKARHDRTVNPDAHGLDPRRFGKNDQRKAKRYSYRRDCVRFSHKVAALTDAALNPEIANRAGAPGWLIMADADLVTHAPVTIEWIHSLVTDPSFYLAWLDRIGWYPECGFVIFREDHPAHVPFMEKFREIYQNDTVFNFPETHDSYVLQRLAEDWQRRKVLKVFGLSSKLGQRATHPFVHSRLAERLDHAKGKFKVEGRTPKGYIRRPEEHWR